MLDSLKVKRQKKSDETNIGPRYQNRVCVEVGSAGQNWTNQMLVSVEVSGDAG